jgi:aminoglycoside 3-N-acetyltransferase I
MPLRAGYMLQHLATADAALLKALSRMFGEAFGETDTYQNALPGDAYLARLLGREHFIAIAAIADDRVVGGLVAYVLDKFEQDRREIYIYDLAVLENHRRKGIAAAVIGELERIAAERNAYVIFVQADLQDDAAIALYDSIGTRTTAHHFDIAVHPRRPRRA